MRWQYVLQYFDFGDHCSIYRIAKRRHRAPYVRSNRRGRNDDMVISAVRFVEHWKFPLSVTALSVLYLVVSIAVVINVVLFVEIFPASIRLFYAAIGYNLAPAMLAGPSPLIGASLVQITVDANASGCYLASVSTVCFAVLW